MHDHEQINLFNLVPIALRRRSQLGGPSYESSCESRNSDKVPKKEAILSTKSIAFVSTKTCCSKNCFQPFPCGKIDAFRSKMYVHGGVFYWKHRQLDLHKQIYRDTDGKEMVTLEGMEVCPKAWTTIMDLHGSSYYRYKADALIGKRAKQHGNLGSKKLRIHTL